jgi:hypothetical protein
VEVIKIDSSFIRRFSLPRLRAVGVSRPHTGCVIFREGSGIGAPCALAEATRPQRRRGGWERPSRSLAGGGGTVCDSAQFARRFRAGRV